MIGNPQSQLRASYAIWIVIAIVTGIYFFWIVSYSLQAPESEDIDSSYRLLTIYFDANNPVDKYEALTAPHAEHRLLFSRLSALFSISVFGYLHIPFLYILGGVVVFLVAFLVYRDQIAVTKTHQPVALLLFVMLLLNPAYRTASFAAWGLSNFASVLLPLLALFALHRRSWHSFFLYEALCFLSINTQGNGVIVVAIGLFYLLIHSDNHRPLKAGLHVVVSCIFLWIYFRGIGGQEYLLMAYRNLYENTGDVILFFFAAFTAWLGQWIILSDLGMNDDITHSIIIASIVGSLLFIAIIMFLKSHFRVLASSHSVRLYFMIYLLATLIIAAWQRSLLWSAHYQSTDISHLWFVVSIRYSFYPLCLIVVFISLCFSVYVDRTTPGERSTALTQYGVKALIAGALIYWACRYYYALPDMGKDAKKWSSCIAAWEQHQQAKPCMWHGDNGVVLKKAVEQGWMRIGETQPAR